MKPVMKPVLGMIMIVCSGLLAQNASAQKTSDGTWQSPIISQARVMQLQDAAAPLNPEHSYKVLFDVSQGAKNPGELVPGLVRAGRFINLASLAKVPSENVNIAIVIHGPATHSVLKESIFRERFEKENQNLKLLSELREAGVEIFVCGQALAHLDLKRQWVSDDVEVAVAALTVVAEYQLNGYEVMP